ncbi:hypothetical protein [Rhodopila sp.]
MKSMILAAIAVVGLGSAIVNAQASAYHPPAQNFQQNNWLNGGD